MWVEFVVSFLPYSKDLSRGLQKQTLQIPIRPSISGQEEPSYGISTAKFPFPLWKSYWITVEKSRSKFWKEEFPKKKSELTNYYLKFVDCGWEHCIFTANWFPSGFQQVGLVTLVCEDFTLQCFLQGDLPFRILNINQWKPRLTHTSQTKQSRVYTYCLL